MFALVWNCLLNKRTLRFEQKQTIPNHSKQSQTKINITHSKLFQTIANKIEITYSNHFKQKQTSPNKIKNVFKTAMARILSPDVPPISLSYVYFHARQMLILRC